MLHAPREEEKTNSKNNEYIDNFTHTKATSREYFFLIFL